MCAKLHTKLTMLMLLPCLLLPLDASMGTAIRDNSTDVLALQDFQHQITHDPTGVLNSWSSSITHCMWDGVNCSATHPGRVVALQLPGLRLAGKISPSVGNLTFLKKLDLSTNSFSGQLPPINLLQKLVLLNLTANSLQDVIPDALVNLTNLEILDLSYNHQLGGEISSRIDRLSKLSVFRLSYNSLTGVIPPTISNLTHLEILGLSYNQLTGSIPDEIGKLSNVWSLLLGGNYLSGRVPRGLFNLSSLQRLGMEINQLESTLPANIGVALPDLTLLLLEGNKFSGQIPASLGNNASGLGKIDLSGNSFTGQIPSSLGKLRKLFYLNLERNNFEARDSQSWEFIDALGNCSLLDVLSLGGNQLQGSIPSSIGKLPPGLGKLYLTVNSLSGIVPPSIGNLSGLYLLGLADNNLSGAIDDEWVRKLTNLQVLLLNSNTFIGQIPASIGNLTKLVMLHLGQNKFEGPIPPSFGKLQQLMELDLGYNNLEGNIPVEVTNLKKLTALNLSSNKFTGEIPTALEQCQNLVTLQMGQNFLVGNIPKSFGNLSNLVVLNISHNNLTGTIPMILDDLQLLRELDLSYNHLQGQIPRDGIFATASAVSLNGNLGLCGGVTDLHFPSCPTASRRIEKGNYLIKVLIPVFGFMSLALLVYFLFLGKKAARSKFTSFTSFGENFLKVSYNDLSEATGNFSESNLIGRGSYGSVYRGRLKETKFELAVKVFDLEMRGAEKSFMSECGALRSIQHRNLLPILTACSTVDSNGNVFKALIYEFMPNGNLDTWIHQRGEGKTSKYLNLTQRIAVAVNMADALHYLHHECGRPTVHRDVKPSNILLDDDMNALLADFGIASFYNHDSPSTSTGLTSSVGVKGTIGYIAPEYAGGGGASTSGDVYSYGIVLMEMITGKRPTDPIFKDGVDIVTFVDNSFPNEMFSVMDHHLIQEWKEAAPRGMISENVAYQFLVSVIQLALYCTRPVPSERMNMKEVSSRMHAIQASYIGYKTKK